MAQGTKAVKEKQPSNAMAKAGSVFLMLAGMWALANIIGVNVEQMAGYGQTYAQKLIYGSNAAAVDIVGVFALTALGAWLAKNGKPWKSAGTYIVVGLAAIFSLQMYYGFTASTRWKPAEEASRRYTAEVEAQKKVGEITEQRRAEHVEYLREEANKASRAASDRNKSRAARTAARDQRQAAYDAQGQVAFGEVTVKAEPIREITDPMAESLAADIGWLPESVQKLQGIYFAIVMMLIHIVAVSGSIAIWPAREALAVALPVPAPVLTDAGNDNEVKAVLGGELSPPNDDGVNAALRRMREGKRLRQGPEYLAETMQFFAEGTAPSAGARIQTSHMHAEYVRWAHANDLIPMDLTPFSSCVADLVRQKMFGLRKSASRGKTYIHGRCVIDQAQGDGLPLLAAAAA